MPFFRSVPTNSDQRQSLSPNIGCNISRDMRQLARTGADDDEGHDGVEEEHASRGIGRRVKKLAAARTHNDTTTARSSEVRSANVT